MKHERFYIGDYDTEFCQNSHIQSGNILVPCLKIVKNKPANLALWIDDIALSYEELWAASVPVARCLTEIMQYHRIESVGIIADRSITSFVSIIASLAAGIPYVPIHHKYPVKRQIRILKQAECSVLISGRTSTSVIEKLLPKITNSVSILSIGGGDIDKNIEVTSPHRLIPV